MFEVGLRVSDAQGERLIRYLPHGSDGITLQRVGLVPEILAQRRASCTAFAAGG